MSDVSSLYRVNLKTGEFSPLVSCKAADLKVKEKQIEEWMALKPNLLFTDEDAVMIIAQELPGEPQADLLAVDSQGNLIIIEIKRHWSDRNTVGQLLDYAARLSTWDYDAFNKQWQSYKGGQARDLFEDFRAFVENPCFECEAFLKTKRLYVLASEADKGLQRIIKWLRDEHNVPIDFVPFAFFKHGNDVFLRMEKIDVKPIPQLGFEGDWFFNSNETYAPGAWGYGEAITKAKMDLPARGDRVFVYVNRKGIIAAGKVAEEISEQGSGIFNKNTNGDEYHRKVDWLVKVPVKRAVSASDVSTFGYNLPVRCTIGRWNDSKVAERVADLLKNRE